MAVFDVWCVEKWRFCSGSGKWWKGISLLLTHAPFATNEFSNFPCHCVWPRWWVPASNWVAYCGLSLMLSSRVHLILDAFLCPFLIQCMMRMQALGTRLGYLCFWHCLVWRNDFIVGQQLVPRDSLSILQLRSWHFLCHCKWPRWWASASFTTYCGYHSIDIEGSCMVLYGCFGPFLPLCMMRTFFILRYLTFSSLLCERVGEVILIFMSCCWESLCRGSVGLCVVGQFATNLQNNPHKLVFGIWVWSML